MVQFVEIPDNLLGADIYYPLENMVGQYNGRLGLGQGGLLCYEGEQFLNRVKTTDPEDQPIYYYVVSGHLPLNVTLDPVTGVIASNAPMTLEHLPTEDTNDVERTLLKDHTWKFQIEATDGVNSVRQGFALTVKHRNLAPIWITPENIAEGDEETTFVANVVAYDPEYLDYPMANSRLTYTMNAISNTSQELVGNITVLANGLVYGTYPEVDEDTFFLFSIDVVDLPQEYDPTFDTAEENPNGTPSDPLTTTKYFTIHSLMVNDPPVWVTPAGEIGNSVPASSAFTFTFEADDPNPLDHLTYTVVAGALPAGLSLDPNTGVISGTIEPLDPVLNVEETDWYTIAVSLTATPVLDTTHSYLTPDGFQVFRTNPGESLSISNDVRVEPVPNNNYRMNFIVRKTANSTNTSTKSYMRPVFDGMSPGSNAYTPIFGNRSGPGYISDQNNIGYDFFDTTDWPLNQWIAIQASYTWPENAPYSQVRGRLRYNRAAYPNPAQPFGRVDGPPYTDAVFEVRGIVVSVGDTIFNFTVRVEDDYGLFEDREFSMSVSATNQPPVWNTDPDLGEQLANSTVSINLLATDPEGEPVTYSHQSGTLPPGLSLAATGLLSGTLAPASVSTPYNFTVRASDGETTADRAFDFAVTVAASGPGENQPPIWTTASGSLGEFFGGDPVSIQFGATDPQSDPLTFAVTAGNLPVQITMSSSGLLSGTIPPTTSVSPTPTSLIPTTTTTNNLVFEPFMQQGGGTWTKGGWGPEGSNYIFVSKTNGNPNQGTDVASSPRFAVYGNSPYTYQYKALAYHIVSGTFGVDIAWYDIDDVLLSYSDSIQDGNVGNPNVVPSTRVTRSKTVTSPPDAAWARVRVYTLNLTWTSGGGDGTAALVQELMVSNKNAPQTFNDDSTGGAPYNNPTYLYASQGSEALYSFTATVSDGEFTVPRQFTMHVSTLEQDTSTITSTQTWTVPAGVTKVMFHWIVAGGGGGGASESEGNGGGGGGGGSGGHHRRVEVNCVPGDVFSFVIGTAGIGATAGQAKGGDGTDTTVSLNGTLLFRAYGGIGGNSSTNNGPGFVTATGGAAGTPNGASGGDGQPGTNDYASVAGAAGAPGPVVGAVGGAAGPAASGAASKGGDGVGFGSGGGGAGSADRTTPTMRPGGNGFAGMVQYTFPSQGPTGGSPPL